MAFGCSPRPPAGQEACPYMCSKAHCWVRSSLRSFLDIKYKTHLTDLRAAGNDCWLERVATEACPSDLNASCGITHIQIIGPEFRAACPTNAQHISNASSTSATSEQDTGLPILQLRYDSYHLCLLSSRHYSTGRASQPASSPPGHESKPVRIGPNIDFTY